ncbi:MAG: hypothetical protein DCC64_10420 [Planctomycetota bacterium]|nr:MAG: hypothetical protein DCC64_10420 [Planctomycetota bacterium]
MNAGLNRGQAWKSRSSVLVFVLLAACSPPSQPPPPPPGSLEFAQAALLQGDLGRYRASLGKSSGLAPRAQLAMSELDPAAWLVAMGARWREYDLAACRMALARHDEAALAAALGFSDDALMAALLDAPSRLSESFAGGRRYFREVDPPLNLLDALELKGGRAWPRAWLVRYHAEISRRPCVLRCGMFEGAASELFADEKFPPAAEVEGTDLTLLRGQCRGPAKEALEAAPWPATASEGALLEFAALFDDGSLVDLKAIRRGGRWRVAEPAVSSRSERLAAAREEALRRVVKAALEFEARQGRWPAPQDLNLRPGDWVDPAAASAALGWAAHDERPLPTLALAADRPGPGEPAVYAVEGKAAMDRGGRMIRRP